MPFVQLRSGTLTFDEDGVALVTHASGVTLTEGDALEFIDALHRHARLPVRLLIDRRPHFDSDFGAILAFRRQLPGLASAVAFFADNFMGRSVALFYQELFVGAGLPAEVFLDEREARNWLLGR